MQESSYSIIFHQPLSLNHDVKVFKPALKDYVILLLVLYKNLLKLKTPIVKKFL
jgi:hypothetical protein